MSNHEPLVLKSGRQILSDTNALVEMYRAEVEILAEHGDDKAISYLMGKLIAISEMLIFIQEPTSYKHNVTLATSGQG